jgi:hypothetical protein
MKKLLVIAVAIFGFIMQACSDPEASSKIITRTSFANDETINIESRKKEFFCDFQWTDGYKTWDYKYSIDDSLGNLGENGAKERWCLIPDGVSTQFLVSFDKWNNGETHYICRNKIAYTRIMNELPEEISIYYDTFDEDRIMKCALLNNKNDNQITVGRDSYTNNEILGTLFQNDRIYHIIKRKDLYSIAGHLSIKHIRPVSLNVLIAFLDADGLQYSLENNKKIMVDSLKNYLRKAGFTLSIPNNIIYRNGADGLRDVNSISGYDYAIGVKYANNREMISNNYPKVSIISDDNNFFSAEPAEKARMLAALLYSKILGRNPIKEKDERWLSYYTKRLDFSQPSDDWVLGRYRVNQQGSLPEFATIMQYFKEE